MRGQIQRSDMYPGSVAAVPEAFPAGIEGRQTATRFHTNAFSPATNSGVVAVKVVCKP